MRKQYEIFIINLIPKKNSINKKSWYLNIF